MPYKKRYKRKKRSNYMNTAHKALKIALATKKLLNVEYKHLDTTATATLGTTMAINALCIPQQGDSNSERIGNSIRMKSLLARFHIGINASATASHVRVLIVLDKQCNGSVVTAAEILEDTSATVSIVSPYAIDYTKRFRVLYDRVFRLNQADQREIYKKVFMKLNYHQQFDASTGGVADLTNKCLYLLRLSDESTNTPNFQYYTRCRYIDN